MDAQTEQTATQMNSESILVLHGFYNLTQYEQQDVLDRIDEYKNSDDKEAFKEKYKKYVEPLNFPLGPPTTGCPCCGRSF